MYGVTARTIRNGILVVLCFLAGYFFCRLGPRSPRAADRGRVLAVDYLYEHADDVTSSQQWRRELSQLKDECDAVPER
jgi:hypothetical protein